MARLTFGQKAFDFYNNISPPKLPKQITIINPLDNHRAKKYAKKFYSTFFNDTNKRIFVLGINPGRFGSSITGINFTDPVALHKYCSIKNSLEKKRELSSEFIYNSINNWGGVKTFYSKFFLTAVSPVGFLKAGKNYNYYDDKDLLNTVQPFIIKTLQEQLSIGAFKTTIILGTGKNYKYLTQLNNNYNFFENIHVLEHPRYIMQYQRKNIYKYLKKYNAVFSQALREI